MRDLCLCYTQCGCRIFGGITRRIKATGSFRDWSNATLMLFTGSGLAKTRSGKIMRRILRKIATNETDQIGDVSTLADPSVVDNLIANR